mgnify:CR=1 FL=1
MITFFTLVHPCANSIYFAIWQLWNGQFIAIFFIYKINITKLVTIKWNKTRIFVLLHRCTTTAAQRVISRVTVTKGNHSLGSGGGASMKQYEEAGFVPLDGYQLRYIYFIDPAYRARLTVPELPYSEIKARGASMYLGQSGGRGEIDNAPQSNAETEGASPIRSLLEVDNGTP